MATIGTAWQAVRRWWQQLTTEDDATRVSGMTPVVDGVSDGVDYSQPLMMPGWLRRDQSDAGRRLREALTESYGATYRSQFGNPYRSASDLPILPVTEDPLYEWDYGTRERVLSNCHAAYNRNPLANSIVQYTTDFVVGDGFNLSTKNQAVEKLLLEFINNPDNNVREYERQAVIDIQVDGEVFLRFFEEQGETVMVPIRPWEVHHIKTEKGFFRRPTEYNVQIWQREGDAPGGLQDTEIERIPAAQVLHAAINRHGYELRGRPELYRLLPWLRADKEWLENRAIQNKWRNALLWVVRVAGNAAAVSKVRTDWRKPPSPGSAYVTTDKVDVSAATNSAGGADAGHDGRAIRLMSVLGARLPEYFFGDGSNSNLASATRQELPALTKFSTFQRVMLRQVWEPTLKRVIQNAVDAGVLPEMVAVEDADGDPIPDQEPVKAVDAFTVDYEPVTSENVDSLAKFLFGMYDRGFISRRTVQMRGGFDPHQEDKQLSVEDAQDDDDMMIGKQPTPPGTTPPGMPSMDDEDERDEEPEADAVQPTPA